jgi:hypothetical protein
VRAHVAAGQTALSLADVHRGECRIELEAEVLPRLGRGVYGIQTRLVGDVGYGVVERVSLSEQRRTG